MPPPRVLKKQRDVMAHMKEKKGCLKGFLRVLFSHIGLFVLVALYAVGGAYILIEIEKGTEEELIAEKQIATEAIKSSKNYIVNYAWHKSDKELSKDDFEFLMKRNLRLYVGFIANAARNKHYDGNPDEWNYKWTFSKSLLFTATTMGAIGYGHIAPVTWSGQFFTMYYGMIGIPLLLLFLANIGEFMANSLRFIYSRLCCRMCRMRRVVSEMKTKTLRPKILWKDEVGMESYMPTSHVDVPIVVNLCLIFIYLMMGGALFSFWENWEMHTSIYFSFITLTTIGFGDYVPGNSFTAGADEGFKASLKMIVTIAYCLFGMALLSMAINLMQEQLIVKFKWLAKEVGITGEENDQSWKYANLKKHDPGTVHETPADRDGNHTSFLEDADIPSLKKKKDRKNKTINII